MIDVEAVRREFPILAREVHGHPLRFFDSAASSQKPQVVIDALVDYYQHHHANVHRGLHTLAEEATRLYEAARHKSAAFIRAPDPREVVFTRGTTEAINLVAQAWARPRLSPGDEVLVTELEHHSNIVPWQLLCGQTGARLVVAPIDDRGDLIFDEYEKLVGPRTRLVATAEISNTLGTVLPVRAMADVAHARGAIVVVDGAQGVPHRAVDVGALGADFYAFSAHKMYGPTGIGVLWGRLERLDEADPWQGGGSMIRSVSFEKTTFAPVPEKFEAGTPAIADAVGLGVAIDWMNALGLDEIERHEHELLDHATRTLGAIDGLTLIGTAPERAGLLSFVLDGIHPHDIGTILDHQGIAVRAGHHCAQPVMQHFDVPATVRASFGVYNTAEDIDALAAGILRVQEIFA